MGKSTTSRARLSDMAAPLRPERAPYYLSTPDGPAEPAPGWYLVLSGAPMYLGANVFAAHDTLRRLVTTTREAAA